MGLAANIDNTGIIGVTMRVQKMTDSGSRIGTSSKHLAIVDVKKKTRRSKRNIGKGICRQRQQNESPTYIALFANNPDTMLRNVHSVRARTELSTLFQWKFNKLQQGNKRKMWIGPCRTSCVRQPKHGL